MSSFNRELIQPRPQTRQANWQPALLLIFAQLAAGLRDMPQFAFFLIYLQEQLALAPVTISSVVAGAQVATMIAALGSGALTARRLGVPLAQELSAYLRTVDPATLAHLLMAAAVAAVESGEEAINHRTLSMADYTGPSERRRQFERVLM